MFSKLSVLRVVPPLALVPVRRLGGLTPLEKFEKLRKLCCTSMRSSKKEEEEEKLRPRVPDPACCVKSCKECCGTKNLGYLNPECKTAFIIGGASGIGYEAANQLLKAGAARVLIGDIDSKTGLETLKKLQKAYGDKKVCFSMVDIRESSTIESVFQEVYKSCQQIDIFINTVGIYNETPQCWDKMIETNLTGCIRGTLLAYSYMCTNRADEEGQSGVILNISSYGPIANVPSMPIFSAASNGIIGLTSSMGQDFHYCRSGIRCVTVCPSCTDTGLLKNMVRKHYDPQWAGFSNSAMKCCTRQSAKVVGKALVHVVRFGESGATYVVKEGKFYKYLMPDYEKIIRQESVLW